MRQQRTLFLLAVLMQALMVGATAAPVAEGMTPSGEAPKMNADPINKLLEETVSLVV